jgi:hypothetical protein
MSRITLVALQNKEQYIKDGPTPYAMFSATVPNETAGQPAHNIVVGLSHGLLDRYGVTPQQVVVLPVAGCTVDTQVFVDNRDGLEKDPDDQIDKVINGESTIVLLGGISATFNKSADFVEAQMDYSVRESALMAIESKRQQKLAQRAAQARILASRSLVGAPAEGALEPATAGGEQPANLGTTTTNRRNRGNNSGTPANAAGEDGPAN